MTNWLGSEESESDMSTVQPRDLAIVVQGLWPNVGRLVFTSKFVPGCDFRHLGLSIRQGWRVRRWGHGPLETTDGPGMVAISPVGSLRRLDPLPPIQMRELEREMARADIDDALSDLARNLKEQYESSAV